jgi:hypothetical protein
MTRRDLLSASLALALPIKAQTRKWQLGINTYCLRFQRWNDRQLLDYCTRQKLDAMFLQDSLDPGVRDPRHWAEVRAWSKDTGMHLETGGSALTGAVNPKTPEDRAKTIAELRMNIDRAKAMGSPIVRTLVAGDRYALPDGSLDRIIESAAGVLREVRSQAMDAGVKIAIENHKELQAWETRTLIETAGKEFVGSYLDTGNPVFVAEDPMTTLEELGPYALTFHLRDSVVYEEPGGIAVQWVPLLGQRKFCRRPSIYIANRSPPARQSCFPSIRPISGPGISPAPVPAILPDSWRWPSAASRTINPTSWKTSTASASASWTP